MKTNKKGTHWGYQQEKWLTRELSRNNKPAWLIQGDQFFGAYHRFESYEKRPPHQLQAYDEKNISTKI